MVLDESGEDNGAVNVPAAPLRPDEVFPYPDVAT